MPGPLPDPTPNPLFVAVPDNIGLSPASVAGWTMTPFGVYLPEGSDRKSVVLLHPLAMVLHGALQGPLPPLSSIADIDQLRATCALTLSVDELAHLQVGNYAAVWNAPALTELLCGLGMALAFGMPEIVPPTLAAHRETVNQVAHELRLVVEAELRADYEMLAGLKGPPGWQLFDSGCWALPFAVWKDGWHFCDIHAERHENENYRFVGWKVTSFDANGQPASHGTMERADLETFAVQLAGIRGWRTFGPEGRWTYLVSRMWDLRRIVCDESDHNYEETRRDVLACLQSHEDELFQAVKDKEWSPLASAILEFESRLTSFINEGLEGLENHPLLGAPAPAGGAA